MKFLKILIFYFYKIYLDKYKYIRLYQLPYIIKYNI